MTDSSTTVQLRHLHSSLGTRTIDIAGLPLANAPNSVSTSAMSADPGTFTQPEALLPKPLPTTFTVSLTDNILLQLWEGIVLELDGNEFTALLRDKTDESHPEEEMTLGCDEIDPADLELLRAGAVFYWSIRYEQGPGVPRCRVSRIRFRRIPGWTASEIRRARSMGREIESLWCSDAQDRAHE